MNTLDQPSVTFRPAAFLSGAPGPWAGHLPFLCDLVAALKPQLVVALGVDYGDSYFGCCQAVQENNVNCTCYGIDLWRGSAQRGSIFGAANRHNDRHYRSFSYLLRSTFDDAIQQFSDESIGLLQIDSARTFEAVEHDFNLWLPKVRPGGVILLHSIAVRSADYGVWRLWEKLGKKFPALAFGNGNGLGVLWKTGGPDDKNEYLQELFLSTKDHQERIRKYYALCAGRLELEHRLGLARNVDAGHSLFQAFRSQGDEYLPDERLVQIAEAGRWVSLFLRFPDGLGPQPLRIDPINRTGVVDIASATLRKIGGRTVWSWDAAEAVGADAFRVEGTSFPLPSTNSLRLLSFGNNPQIYFPELPGVGFEDPLELEIRLRIDLEMNAVREAAEQGPAFGKDGDNSGENQPEASAGHSREELELALEEERKANNAAKAEREKMHTARGLLSQELSIARGNVEELKSEIEHISSLQSQAEADALDLRKANARISAILEQERTLRLNMENSYTWQITAPFRKLASLFGSTEDRQRR